MNRRQITYFLAVADTQSFSRAGERLHVAQSALSMRINDLERSLGVRLFERESHGVRLSAAGRQFLPHAQNIQDAFEQAARSVERPAIEADQAPRLGVTPTVGTTLLPHILEASAARSPSMAWRVRQASSLALVTMLRSGEIDVAVGYLNPHLAEIRALPLYSDDMALIGPPSLLGDPIIDITFAALSQFHLVLDPPALPIRQVIDAAATRTGNILRIQEIEPLSVKKTLIVTHEQCTIAPANIYDDEIRRGLCVARRIVRPKLPLPLYLLLSKSIERPEVQKIRSIVDTAVNLYAEACGA